MIEVLPERTFSGFSPIVLLRGTTRRKLDTLRDDLTAIPVINEKMYVFGSSGVIEDDNPKALPGLEKPVEPRLPILGKLQQELLFVATVRYMPHMARNVMPARSLHVYISPRLDRPFIRRNAHSKLEKYRLPCDIHV